ncbi:MAG: serine/threonine protein kinase [Pseudomonadota bacterium]|nr:serine/threonine protein kinase [Pseudomonadota bacterium]
MSDGRGKRDPPPLLRIEDIFHAVLAVPSEQQGAFLESCCGGDAELMAELRSLLEASEAEGLLGVQRAAAARGAGDAAIHGGVIGPYHLERLLGRGGMGAVYLAHRADGHFDQQVAIKLIDLPLATELFRERFRLERQILAGLVHPYIARLLDGGVSESGEPYLVMEYVDGISITEFCERQLLSLRERLALFKKVCEAVQFAHQNLVVHRDLKPDNILVVADGTPRLLDFGTAKLLVPVAAEALTGFTQQGLQIFTPQYASPEQVLGGAITTASDTYALGVLLFVLLTGRPPYAVKEFTTGEMLRVICSEQPPRPGSVLATAGCADFRIDADLDAIALKALRKEPAQRYPAVEQLSADVEAWLNGYPVAARRGNRRYRASKFARRNKIPLLAAGLLMASIIAGIGGVLWQSRVANQHRRSAEARAQDLRELSNSLLSEIDEAIKELPGSTPVQRLLVARVLDHLDRMSKDANADEPTQADLVEAYTRLGNLQGNPYEQNIGDPAGARVSLDKAIQIAKALNRKSPNNAHALASMALAEQSLGEVLFGIGQIQAAVSVMQAAVAAYESRLAIPGATASDFAEAASAVGALGDLKGQAGVASLGDQVGALQAYRNAMDLSERALHVDPGFVRARRGVAIDHLKIGNILLTTDPVKALDEYRRSFAAWKELPEAEQPAASTRRGIAQTHIKIGAALRAVDEYARSIAEFEEARPTLEYLAAADAEDSRASYDLAEFYSDEALTYVEKLKPVSNGISDEPRLDAQHAIELLRKSMSMLQRLVSLNPANRGWVASLAYQQVVVGSLEQTFDMGKDGVQLATDGMATLVASVRAEDANVDVLDMATSAGLTVLPKRLRDSHWTARCAERLVDATHRKNPSFLLSLAQALQAEGRSLAAEDAAAEALALLPALGPDSVIPRLNRELRLIDPGN